MNHVRSLKALGVLTAVLACFAISPAHGKRPTPTPTPVPTPTPTPLGEDRGNGNSAAENVQALNLGTTGSNNTAHGWFSLISNTSGERNTATGTLSLAANTTGSDNTADGYGALNPNTTGGQNTATGAFSLVTNTTGVGNTADGYVALQANTSGNANIAIGAGALFANTTGSNNIAMGFNALAENATGSFNTGLGYGALRFTTEGGNTATGAQALRNNATGNNNTAIGLNAGLNIATASNVTCIGANVLGADADNTTWIGNVYGNITLNGQAAPVVVSVDGQLATNVSSARFKKDIATMERASEAILALRPVTFRYKKDTTSTAQFGLIAEEVAKIDPALVLPDKEGKPLTVRYDAVNAMLLNEFLKEHKIVQEQQKEIDALKTELKQQAAQIQKVSAQFEASKSTPQTVSLPALALSDSRNNQ